MNRRADYEVGTLESKVEMQINNALNSIQSLVGSLNTLKSTLNSTLGSANNNKLKQNADSAVSKILTIKKALNLGALYVGLKKGWTVVKNVSTAYIDMIETNNLFEVSMGKVVDEYGNLDKEASKYYTKAIEFQDKMNEKLLTNKAELKEFQAMFYNLFRSQSISKDASYLMSESLTKAGYDISSLYNLTVDEAMNKIKSGIAGQVESLRTIGIDVSESALSKVLNDVGITDRSVQQLSYAEKEIARYIAIVNQASKAQGDFAKTIDSPANQLKMLKNQFIELQQVAGSFIINTFGGLITYATAVIMVIKELLKSLADLFGYELTTSSSNVASNTDDIEDSLSGAVGKAKELKKQLMGFDEINNITPNTSSSGSSSNAYGIDDKLLNALTEWDNKMSGISNKATEIRDKMLDWLGVTDGSYENLNKILEVVKTIGVAFATWKVASTITDLMNNLDILSKTQSFQIAFGLTLLLTGIYAQYKGTSHLLDGDVDLFTILESVLGTTSGTFGIASILKATKLGKELGFGKSLVVGLGIMMSIQAIQILSEGINAKNIQNELLGALELGFGTGLTVTMLSGNVVAGLTVGITITSLVGLTALISNNDDYTESIRNLSKEISENVKIVQQSADSWKNKKNAIEDSLSSELTEIGYIEKLIKELDNIVESNGKVKAGYEDRVKFILNELNESFGTEYALVDGQITKNGELINSYDEIKNSIAEIIELKKAEAIAEANQELYVEAIKNQTKYYQERKKAIENNVNIEREFSKALEEVGLTIEDFTEGANNSFSKYNNVMDSVSKDVRQNIISLGYAYEDSIFAVEEAENTWKECTGTIISYENLKTAIITGDSEKINQAVREMTNTYETETGTQTQTLAEEIDKQSEIRKTATEYIKSQNQELTDELKNSLNTQLKNLGDSLREQTSTIEQLTPEQIKAWRTLAETAEDIYNDEISQVDEDTRTAIEAITRKVDINSQEYIDKWFKLANESSERYNQALSKLPEETQKEIQSAVDKINEKTGEAKKAGENVADSIENGVGTVDTTDVGKQVVNGVATGINNNKNNSNIWNALGNLKTAVTNKLKSLFGIASPSKVMRDTIGKFIPLGIAEGIEGESDSVFKSVQELANGIKVNTQDLKVDTNQYIDYGTISGQIQAQSSITMNSNVVEGIAQAVKEAMKDTEVNVNIEARTDEGTVVKKASDGFKKYIMQTGELPFPVPIS